MNSINVIAGMVATLEPANLWDSKPSLVQLQIILKFWAWLSLCFNLKLKYQDQHDIHKLSDTLLPFSRIKPEKAWHRLFPCSASFDDWQSLTGPSYSLMLTLLSPEDFFSFFPLFSPLFPKIGNKISDMEGTAWLLSPLFKPKSVFKDQLKQCISQ